MEVNLIGIYVGDNDFYYTMRGFMRLLLEGYENGNVSWAEKEIEQVRGEVAELWNRAAVGVYWVCQNGLNYDRDDEHIAEYLRKDPSRVYINGEVKKFLDSHEWNGKPWLNGEMVLLNLHTREISLV
jgi:hypothetical protein